MIQLTEEQVEKYMALYLEKYGVPIDKPKALDELTALVCLLISVHKHVKQNDRPDFSDI